MGKGGNQVENAGGCRGYGFTLLGERPAPDLELDFSVPECLHFLDEPLNR
jgi:hypothetical protein